MVAPGISRESAPAPVVIMSTSDEPSDIKRAYELGVNCYLAKTCLWNEFREQMKA